jgi:hypothetical protein
MKLSAILIGLVSALSLPSSAHALGEIIVGNEPLRGSYPAELLAAVNMHERTYLYIHDFQITGYFKGGPKALNESMRRFAAIPADAREIVVMPAPGKPVFGEKIGYDWSIYIPGYRQAVGSRRVVVEDSEIHDYNRAKLTIYIPEPLPPALADPKQARMWIADLDNNDFKTRDRATKQLADLGPAAAALLREALKNRPSPEARERLERLLSGVTGVIRLDVLEFPDAVPVASVDTLLVRGRKHLASKHVNIRADAAMYLAHTGAPASEVLPDLEKLLKSETYAPALATASQAAWILGADAKPLLPVLRETVKTDDKNLANVCGQAISAIEKATAEPVAEAEAKKRSIIRKEIREFVDALRAKAAK